MDHTMGFSDRNEAQAVVMKMEQAPHRMLSIEFIQNAIEHGATEVIIGKVKINGAVKLSIKNNGAGMSKEDMQNHLMDLYSSSKTTGADANRGIGARVTALRGNPVGVIYRSCHKGKTHEMKMYFDEAELVYKCTEPKRINRMSRHDDYVETIFMGESAGANTYTHPYPGATSKAQLAYDVLKTIYRLPEGFSVKLPDTNQFSENVLTFSEYINKRDIPIDSVTCAEGITYHYINIERLGEKVERPWQMSNAGPIRGTPAPCGVIYKDRLYDVLHGKSDWASRALRVGSGLELIAEKVVVLIELPNDFPVVPTEYRTAIQWREKREKYDAVIDDEVEYLQFSEQVIRLMPAWVRELLNAARKSVQSSSSMDRQFREMMDQFDILEDAKKPDPEGEYTTGEGDEAPIHDPDKKNNNKNKSRVSGKDGDKPAKKLRLPKKMPDVRFHYAWESGFPFESCSGKPLYISHGLLGTENDLVHVNMEYPLFRSLVVTATDNCSGEPMHANKAAEDAVRTYVVMPYMAALYVTFKMSGKTHKDWIAYAPEKDNHLSAASSLVVAMKDASKKVISYLRQNGFFKDAA